MYTEDANGNLLRNDNQITLPFHTEHKDGHTVYNFKINMNAFQNIEWNEDYQYYLVPVVQETFSDRYTIYQTLAYPTSVLYYDSYHYGLYVAYDPDYCSSFESSGATVTYSDAAYGCDPVLTFNSDYSKLKGSKTFQWQVLEGDEWVDYGNSRISVELAVEVLLKHEGLTGKQVRMKITSYDGIYDDALYSNACQVQPDQNTRMPQTGSYVWREDPNHSGKYILESTLNTGAQEYLIRPHANAWGTLDWSSATDEPVFDNLDMGYYDIFTRYKATADYYAGTEVIRSKAVAGPYTLTQGFEIRHDDKPVDEVIVEVGKEFRLRAVANPEDATDKTIINMTRWSPESDKTQMISANWLGTYYKFENNYTGSSIWLRGDEVGVVTVQALTTLDDGTNVRHEVTIRIVPVGYVPYTVTVLNNGTKVAAGALFDPLLRIHDRKASRVDGDLILEDDIKLILQSQMLARKINWTLVGGNLTYDRTGTIVSNSVASMRMDTGRIKVLEGTKPGTVIRFVGYLDDPYLGRIAIPGSITVVAAPEVEIHTHDYEGYAQSDEETHFRICACGEQIGEAHSFTQHIVQEATYTTNAILGMTCACGYYYEAELEDSILVHTHALEYVYDLTSHWQLCADETCPDAYSTAHQSHEFALAYTDDDGKECYACSVCGTLKLGDQVSVQIVTQPKNATAINGATASVRVVASGDGLTYKWYYKSKGQTSFSLTTAFTGNSYNVQMNASRAERQVYCVITDAYGNSVQTETVTLYMGNPLKITAQPNNAVAPNGAMATVAFKATGDGLTYKWYYMSKGQTAFGLTTAFSTNTYSVQMNASRAERQVYCVITDKYGNVVKTEIVTLNMK